MNKKISLLFCLSSAQLALGATYTWNGTTPSVISATNWSPAVRPVAGDIATFSSTGVTNPLVPTSAIFEVQQILYDGLAQVYSFTVNAGANNRGLRIINGSLDAQLSPVNQIVTHTSGFIQLNNSAILGSPNKVTINTNPSAGTSSTRIGLVELTGASADGGNAIFNVTRSNSLSLAQMLVSAGANLNNAKVDLNANAIASSASLTFDNNSSAGTSQITANSLSEISFNNSSTAASSTITLNDSSLAFNAGASAQNATITANSGSSVSFNGSSIGGTASLFLNPSTQLNVNHPIALGKIDSSATSPIVTSNVISLGATNLSSTLLGGVSGAGGFAFSGSGTLRLSGLNTFSGGVTMNSGTLHIESSSALGSSASSFTVNSPITVDNISSSSLTLNNHPQNWNGNITFTGTRSLNLGSGNVNLGANIQLVVSNNTLTVGGVINDGLGTFGINKLGAGELVLSSINTYKGTTQISAGTLKAGTQNIFGVSPLVSSLVLSGGTFDMNGFTQSIGSITGTSNIFSSASGSVTLLVGSNNSSPPAPYSGVISNGVPGAVVSVTKQGSGTITFSGANTYTGNTTISGGGTLRAGNNNVFGGASSISNLNITLGTLDLNGYNLSFGSLNSSGAITSNSPGNVTLTVGFNNNPSLQSDGAISNGLGSLALKKVGTATYRVVPGVVNSYSGGTSIEGGTISIAQDNHLGSANTAVSMLNNTTLLAAETFVSSARPLSLTGTPILSVNNARSMSWAGVISGAALEKQGLGTLVLTEVNTYNGGTAVTGGTLRISQDSNLGSLNTSLSINNATLSSNGTFTSSNRTLTLSNTCNIDIDSLANVEWTALVQGTGSLVKRGAGTLKLSASNTYLGATSILGGRLEIAADNNLGAASSSLSINSSTLATTSTFSTSRPLTMTSNATLEVASGTTLTWAALIAGPGGVLNKTGSGTLALNHNNSYAGGTILLGGTLNINNAGALGSGALVIQAPSTLDNDSGSGLTLAANNVQNWNADFTFTGSNDLNLGTGNTILGANRNITIANNNLTVGGVITGASCQISKFGAGTLTLSGNNTFDGGVVLNNGLLNIGSPTAIGQGPFSIAGTCSFDNSSGAPLTLTNNNLQNWDGNFTFIGTQPLNMGTGNVNLLNSCQGTVTNTLTLGGPLIGGAVSLTKNGPGVLVLNSSLPSTFSGGLSVLAGELVVDNDRNLGAVAGAVAVTNATLSSSGSFTSSSRPTTITGTANFNIGLGGNVTWQGAISGGTLVKQGSGQLTLTGSNSYSGGTQVTSGTLGISSDNQLGSAGSAVAIANATLSSSGSFTSSSRPTTITGGANFDIGLGGNVTWQGVIGGGALTKDGVGTLVLTGANNYSGGTTINAGTLRGNSTSLQGTITNSSTLQFNQTSIGSFNGTFSGGTVEKLGASFLTLATANTASVVDIQNGTLVVNGSIGGGGITTVQPGGSLKGIGTLTQDVTVYGSIKPGTSIGTINLIGDQVLASGSVYELEVNATSSDLINITGSLTIQPGAIINLLPDQDNYLDTISYTVIRATDGIAGEFSAVTTTYPLYALEVNYSDPLEVVLNISFIEFIDVFNQGNPGQVANCLDELLFSGNQDLISIINEIRFIPELNDINTALNSLQPSAFTSLATSSQEVSLTVSDNIFNRLREINPLQRQKCDKQISTWFSPLMVSMNQLSNLEPGYRDNAVGGVAGIDFAVGKHTTAGLALGYAFSRLDWRQSRGASNENSWCGALYQKFATDKVFLELQLMGQINQFYVDRAIQFQGVNRTAKSSHQGLGISGHLKAGFQWGKENFKVLPYARLDYLYDDEAPFREYGADSIDLIVESKKSSLFSSEGGLEFHATHRTATRQVTTLIGLSAIYEKRAIGEIEKASFVEGCQMIVKGLNPSRPLASATLGLNLASPQYCLDASVIYKGKFSQSFQSSALEAKITKKF